MVSLMFSSTKEVHLLLTTAVFSLFLWILSICFVIEYTRNQLLVIITSFFIIIWLSCVVLTSYKLYSVHKERKDAESEEVKQETVVHTWVTCEPPVADPEEPVTQQPQSAPVSITCIYNMLTFSYVATLWSSLIIGANLFLTVVIYIDASREYAPALFGGTPPPGADHGEDNHNTDPTFLTKHILIPLIVYIACILAWMCSVIFGGLINHPLESVTGDDPPSCSSSGQASPRDSLTNDLGQNSENDHFQMSTTPLSLRAVSILSASSPRKHLVVSFSDQGTSSLSNSRIYSEIPNLSTGCSMPSTGVSPSALSSLTGVTPYAGAHIAASPVSPVAPVAPEGSKKSRMPLSVTL